MKSGKQKAKEIKRRRDAKKLARIQKGKVRINTPILADWSKLKSPSCMPNFPTYYFDREFTCKDCGKVDVWTPLQQKWWYEQVGGNIETTAIRCRPCRIKERIRKAEARRIHLEGIKNKNA